MINIIDRYIIKQFLINFLSGLAVFVTIFLAVDFMSSFLTSDTSTATVIRYYSYMLPSIIYQMTPVACLLATVFTLSGLNKTSELVALFSLGLSLARVSGPILILVGLISALSFWLGDRILPRANQQKNYVYYVDIKNRPGLYSTVKTNKIWYRSENQLFNIKSLDIQNKKAQGLTLYHFDQDWNLIQLINAKNVNMMDGYWALKDGSVTFFTEETSFPLTQAFQDKNISMDENLTDIQKASNSSDVMSLNELDRFIDKNKESGLDTLHYEVDYHSKFSFAFAAFVMSLMGIPFSVAGQRSGGMMVNAGKCIGLAFLYWTTYSAFLTVGKHGVLMPFFAAWVPNILTVLVSLYLLARLKK